VARDVGPLRCGVPKWCPKFPPPLPPPHWIAFSFFAKIKENVRKLKENSIEMIMCYVI
jgi:hypothetical protein